MDGVSSVMAVASLALQLVDSVKQLCDFWDSVQEAPSKIAGLVDDLKIFAAVLAEVQHDEEIFGPQKITLLALESCRVKVNALHALLQPAGFSSSCKIVRKWASVKAVLRKDKVERFRSILGGAQSTLISAQVISLRRSSQRQLQYHEANRYRSEYNRAVDTVEKDLAGLRMEQSSELVMTTTSAPSIAEHLEDIKYEIRKMAANIPNPVIRAGCEQGMVTGLEQIFPDPLPANPFKISPKSTTARSTAGDRGYGRSSVCSRSSVYSRSSVVLSRKKSIIETFFGSISFYMETSKSHNEESATRKTTPSEYYEYKTLFRLFPASWLINMGLDYTINFTFSSNYQGWHQCLESMRAISGDSLIFHACGEGDLDLVQHLLSTGDASVWDQNLIGVTPLHIAAYFRRPAVVQYLLEHGADGCALMQTWGKKLLSPAKLASTMSYDNFLAPYRHNIFGTLTDLTEILAHFSTVDGDIGDSRGEPLVEEVLSNDWFLHLFDAPACWLTADANNAADIADDYKFLKRRYPSITNIIARCVNLSPQPSTQHQSSYLENLTSLSMRYPSEFQLWQSHYFRQSNKDRQKFLSREVSEGRLGNDGWTSATLGELFLQNYTFSKAMDPPIFCKRCRFSIKHETLVEWEEYVDGVKAGNFVVREDQTHKIRAKTPAILKENSHESGIFQLRDMWNLPPPEVWNLPLPEERLKASKAREAVLRDKPKRYMDELQFWNHGHGIRSYLQLYRTRELYDIYAETGFCPSCAIAVGSSKRSTEESAEESEHQPFTDADEEPPMLAPF